ncbi:hypothetical protein [Pedosphaera parvula]|nr:hypothetical protein [Pedosphaera parvula]
MSSPNRKVDDCAVLFRFGLRELKSHYRWTETDSFGGMCSQASAFGSDLG